MGDHRTLAMIGFFLILAGLLIASILAYQHRDAVLGKLTPAPEEPLPWDRWGVVLHVCMGLCWLGGFVVPLLPGVAPTTDAHTVAGISATRVAVWGFFTIYIVVLMRNYRRRRAERARREVTRAEVDP